MAKRIFLGCGFVILLAVGGFLLLLSSASREFKPLVVGILHLYNDDRVTTIYEESSDQLKARMTEDVLRQDLAAIRSRLGEFKEAGPVSGGGHGCSTSEGSSGSIEVDLKFEKGNAKGTFEFALNADTWKLDRISVVPTDTDTPTPSSQSPDSTEQPSQPAPAITPAP